MLLRFLFKPIELPIYVFCLAQMLTTFIAIQLVLSGFFNFYQPAPMQPEIIYVPVQQPAVTNVTQPKESPKQTATSHKAHKSASKTKN